MTVDEDYNYKIQVRSPTGDGHRYNPNTGNI